MTNFSAKQVAVNAAKVAARESHEIFKSAGEQILPVPEKPQDQKSESVPNTAPPGDVKRKNLSFLNDYKHELDQIRRDNLFKELQQKITAGEEVNLENYVKELGYAEREVLMAQMEAIKARKAATQTQEKKSSIPEVISKKGRQMFNKIKKRNEQHIETRMPPSS